MVKRSRQKERRGGITGSQQALHHGSEPNYEIAKPPRIHCWVDTTLGNFT